MSDMFDALLGNGQVDPAELAQRLRGQQQLGTVASMTGIPGLQKLGPQMINQAAQGAQDYATLDERKQNQGLQRTLQALQIGNQAEANKQRSEDRQFAIDSANQNSSDNRALRQALAKNNGPQAPSGYRWNADQSGLEPIPGGPASGKGKTGALADRMNPTMLGSVKLDMSEVNNALDSFKGIQADKTGPFFSAEKAGPLARWFHSAVTPEQSQNYEVYANRLAVGIASIQSMGRGQISDAKVREARKLVPQPGDAKSTIAVKLSQIKKISDMANEALYGTGNSDVSPTQPAADASGGLTPAEQAELSSLKARFGNQ